MVGKYAPADDDGEVDEQRVAEVKAAFDSIEKEMIRKAIAVDKKRPDGRAQDEIRPIECEVDVSPRVHGSALFTRGETQILSNVALGTTRMDMRLDTLGLQTTKRFWHHYNFPPFSVGEAGFMRGPKRRDIGHGALAERALVATIPDEEDVPVRDPRRSPRRSSPTAPPRWARSAPPRWRCRPRACRSPLRSPASPWA